MCTYYLIGFMGSGKSTIGKELSHRLDVSYIDTDTYIEKTARMMIKDIFREDGEAYFRELETNALKECVADIISTGGGIVEKDENIEEMRKKGKVIYLDVTFSEICKRLEADETRPLWTKNDLEDKEKMFKRRESLYKQASDYIITCDGKDVNTIYSEIISKMQK